jgi:hypothetical protein
MKTRHASFRHVACFFLVVAVFAAPFAQAQDEVKASTQYVPLDTGVYQKLETAVAKADAIFIGEVTDQGSEALLQPGAPTDGLLYRGVGIKVHRSLLGMTSDEVTAAVYIVSLGPKRFLTTDKPCIFFLQTHRQSWPCYPFSQLGGDDAGSIVIKLIPATDENVAEVKKLIKTRL